MSSSIPLNPAISNLRSPATDITDPNASNSRGPLWEVYHPVNLPMREEESKKRERKEKNIFTGKIIFQSPVVEDL